MNPTLSHARAAFCRLIVPAVSLAFSVNTFAQGSAQGYLGIDANSNQISDLYEALYPGSGTRDADNDSDGMTNGGEAAAGTNPNNSSDNLNFSSVTNTGTAVEADFRSVAGKIYQLQSATGLEGPWTNEGPVLPGDGTALDTSMPSSGARTFLRIQVTDVDTDADGVTDWEELHAGTNRYLWDTDGDGFSDRSYVEALVAGSSTVNIQAADSWAREGIRPGTFRITRHGGFLPLTIPLATGGSALPGTDYTLSAARVSLPAGTNSAIVTMTALTDALMEDAETVTLTIQADSSYTVGVNSTAAITIISQGLTGQYFNTSASTYADPLNFDPAALALTRRDASVDFDWSKPAGTPAGTGTGTPDPLIADDDLWTIRWSGFIYPGTNEIHQLRMLADRGAVVWVSPTPIAAAAGATTGARINVWSTTSPSTLTPAAPVNMVTGTGTVVAGQPYYFRVDYRDSATFTNNANIQVRWSTPTIAEQAIPMNSLSSEGFPGQPPVITSGLIVAGISGAPFNYQITATNSPTSYTASGLPAGLSVNGTGLISGIATGAGGYYFSTITASNATGSGSANLVIYLHATGGSITREVWNGVAAATLASIPFYTAPSSTTTISTMESPDNAGDTYGERIRGFITAPASGLYTFFLSSDENAEFWVSSSEEPGQKLKRSWVSAGSIADGVWDAQASQRSVTMRMAAGRRYYVEAIRLESTGDDHLAVSWLKPGQTNPAQKEIIPGWALTSYSPSVTGGSDGTLYAANLTPQAGANTLGSGVALLLVNPEKTGAQLSYTYSNLTGSVNSGAHIHDSRTIMAQAGRIIYDVDDFPADAYGNHPWDFSDPPLFSHSAADIVAAIEGGFAYLNLHTTAYPNGEIKGLFYPVSGSQFFVPPAPPVPAELTIPSDPTAAKNEIVRFLQQATLGARHDSDGVAPWDPDSIESVQALGYSAWLDAQLAMSPGTDPETLNLVQQPPTVVYPLPTTGRQTFNGLVNAYNGSGPLAAYVNDYYQRYPRTSTDINNQAQSAEEIWRAWWAVSVKHQDQLRHRMAFALSQILVVSEEGELDDDTRAIVHYYDLLYYHGLGNFRTLLEKTTLNVSMGRYLDMIGNRKPNLATGYIPNENFAREILQLFTLGLNRLHPDGSNVLSAAGTPVPTYEQDNVVGFAHTFTGWNYPASTNNRITPMVPRSADHDTGEKLLLESAVIAGNAAPTVASCDAELDISHDVIFHHPNVGPFIGRQLIQRMVTANPSPGYIYRVASVFDNDGTGVRGNLSAVAKAILLDPEARNQAPRTQAGFGHLKEPVIRATQMLRAFRPFSYAEVNHGSNIDLGSCVVATQANIDLSVPLPTTDIDLDDAGILYTPRPYTIVDGYALGGVDGATVPVNFGIGNTLLVRMQTNPAENGIYVFNGNGTLLTRAARADSGAELTLAYVRITAGTNTGATFRQMNTVSAPDTDPQDWALQASSNLRRRLWEMGSTSGTLFQTPMRSPTVFNFYEPGYVFQGKTGENGLYGPEFQITSETSVINTGNWFYTLTRQNTATSLPHTNGQGYAHAGTIGRDVKMDVTGALPSSSEGGALVDYITGLVMPGQLTPQLRTLLADYLNNIPVTLIPAGSTWSYSTDAAGLGASNVVEGHAAWSTANWKHADFNDAAWLTGPAQFGYGDNDEATVLPYGGVDANRWVSSYFRREFTVTGAAGVTGLTVNIKRDDGAIVYINGREAGRSNMTNGTVYSGTTLAPASTTDEVTFFPVTVPVSYLVEGRNVIAVEIHQASLSSSDVSFDAELKSTGGSSGGMTSAERMSRIGEALHLISLSPEFATQK